MRGPATAAQAIAKQLLMCGWSGPERKLQQRRCVEILYSAKAVE